MKVSVRYFASLREALGSGESLELRSPATVRDARDQLAAKDAAHAAVLNRSRLVRSALNQVLCDEATALVDGCELGFFPPVTGG